MKDFTSKMIDGLIGQKQQNDRALDAVTGRISDPDNADYPEDVADAVRLIQHNALLMKLANYLHQKEDQNIKKIFRE